MFCYVLLPNFLLDFNSFCWLNKEGMNAKENMHEVRFPNIYILSHIFFYIVPLLYYPINYCFGNKSSRNFKGQTNSQYHVCNALWWNQRLSMNLFIWILYYLRLKDLFKTTQSVAPLIIHGKWKVFAGLQIHPKTILTRTNKARKARR